MGWSQEGAPTEGKDKRRKGGQRRAVYFFVQIRGAGQTARPPKKTKPIWLGRKGRRGGAIPYGGGAMGLTPVAKGEVSGRKGGNVDELQA